MFLCFFVLFCCCLCLATCCDMFGCDVYDCFVVVFVEGFCLICGVVVKFVSVNE